jgi:hypothetical protein
MQTIKADTTVTQRVKQQIIYLIDVTARDIDRDSTTELAINVSYVDITGEVDGKKFRYQSGQNFDSTQKSQFPEFKALINNPFNVTINKIGEITEVFKVDRILNKFLDIVGNADKLSTDEKSMLKQKVVEIGLRPILVQLFRKLPDYSVAKDSSWQNKQPASRFLSYSVQTSNDYKVKSLEMLNDDKIAVLDANLTAKAEGQSKVTEKGVNYDIKKPVTSGEGKVFFNVSKGVIQKSKTSSRVELNMNMEGPTPKGGRQKMSQKKIMENSNILELL